MGKGGGGGGEHPPTATWEAARAPLPRVTAAVAQQPAAGLRAGRGAGGRGELAASAAARPRMRSRPGAPRRGPRGGSSESWRAPALAWKALCPWAELFPQVSLAISYPPWFRRPKPRAAAGSRALIAGERSPRFSKGLGVADADRSP